MRLATVRYEGRSHAARIEDDHVELLPAADVGALLAAPGGLEAATAVPAVAHAPKDAVVTLTLVPRPAKILCIGQNYLAHIEETGATPPEYPTVFAKYARALIGDGDPIVLPAVSAKVDWEVELVAVIGREVRNAGPRRRPRRSPASPSATMSLLATFKGARRNGCREKPVSRPLLWGRA